MIKLKKGNVFNEFQHCDFIVIFGHLELNELRYYWDNFRENNLLELPKDPFFNKINKITINNKFIWFVSEEENHGINDISLDNLIYEITKFALENGLNKIVFNGAQNINHWLNSTFNQTSDDERVSHIIREFSNQFASQKYLGDLVLISLSDSFEKLNHA